MVALADSARYLRNFSSRVSPFLQKPQAHLTVSLSCALHLTSSLDLVDPRITNSQCSTAVELCLFDLQLYAHDHWLDHVLELGDQKNGFLLRDQDLNLLANSLERLTSRYDELAPLQDTIIPEKDPTIAEAQLGTWNFLKLSTKARALFTESSVRRMLHSTRDALNHKDTCTLLLLKESGLYCLTGFTKSALAQRQSENLLLAVRDRYRKIVEELLERQEPVSSALEEFRKRHSCGSFYCHYPGCSHAANSSELRHEHEESHLPRFVCMQAGCGFFGWTFRTRSSLFKHNKQYHEEKVDQRVPSSLIESEDSLVLTSLHTWPRAPPTPVPISPLTPVRMPAFTTDQQKLTLIDSSHIRCILMMISPTPICLKILTSRNGYRIRAQKNLTSVPQQLMC